MKEGWSAKGRLRPLWKRVGGRDGLAQLTGISGQTLSAYNSGSRQLGIGNGRRIADALGVTLLDLGAPEEQDAAEARTLRDLIAGLAETVDLQQQEIDELKYQVRALGARPAKRRHANG